jgi:hypothetical protein
MRSLLDERQTDHRKSQKAGNSMSFARFWKQGSWEENREMAARFAVVPEIYHRAA